MVGGLGIGWVEVEEREDGGWVGDRLGGRGGEGRWWVGWVEEREKRVMRITFMFYRYMITN